MAGLKEKLSEAREQYLRQESLSNDINLVKRTGGVIATIKACLSIHEAALKNIPQPPSANAAVVSGLASSEIADGDNSGEGPRIVPVRCGTEGQPPESKCGC